MLQPRAYHSTPKFTSTLLIKFMGREGGLCDDTLQIGITSWYSLPINSPAIYKQILLPSHKQSRKGIIMHGSLNNARCIAAFAQGFQLASGCILFNPDSNPPLEVG